MSLMGPAGEEAPIFRAVSGSARQLYLLLNCIRLAPKVQVQIRNDGLNFSMESARVMQGAAFLDKALFTSYNYTETEESADDVPTFQISLHALLETLQIFGATENASRFQKSDSNAYISAIRPNRLNAFSNQALGMMGACRLSYTSIGAPLSIILEESGVTTTCDLNTYEPESTDDIPFQSDRVQAKIIMPARWLFDAISELASTSPARLDIVASPSAPYLSLSASGPLGSATVDFGKGKGLFEIFTVARKWVQSYKFDMVKTASEAMRLASKVSIRGDEQGVLSLQFMVEVENGGVSFVHFKFIPFVRDEDEDEDEDRPYEDDGTQSDEEEEGP